MRFANSNQTDLFLKTHQNSESPDSILPQTSDFDYYLPNEAIALFPLEERDASKLLIYRKGQITHSKFRQIPDFLPSESLLVFNNTKVLPARLHFLRKTGSRIELLIIEHSTEKVDDKMQLVCRCMVGNKKKWSENEFLESKISRDGKEITLITSWKDRETNLVVLSWQPESYSFFEIIDLFGEMPIPPYLNREANESDKSDYQTVYASKEGAIAAPTAGLHFTDSVLLDLESRKIETAQLTLHVGLGTFLPMKSGKVEEHKMHEEEVIIPLEVLNKIAHHKGPIIAVGTTSIRSLESLYWLGSELMTSGSFPFELQSEDPYKWSSRKFTRQEIALCILEYARKSTLNEIRFYTRLFIMPGYSFKVVDGLITNFHQPKSTLLVLIASFIGSDWKKIYQEALDQNYRFLSYGDSSLLLP